MTQTLKIDVYVELICPWCLIGKSNLESALAQLAETDPDLHVQVQWHTVQLVPEVPSEGWPFAEFYLRRLGSPEAVRQRQAQVRAAAAQAGVEIDFARIERFPNTTLAHRLLAFAEHQPSVVDAMLDRLFEAYFQRGENIGDVRTLLDIAQELGLDREAAAACSTPSRHGRPSLLQSRGFRCSYSTNNFPCQAPSHPRCWCRPSGTAYRSARRLDASFEDAEVRVGG